MMSIKFFLPSTIHNFHASFSDTAINKGKGSDRQRGQTSVEYILLLAVVIFMILSIMNTVKRRFIAEQTPCPTSDKSLGCMISRSVSSFGSADLGFRHFQIRR